MFQRWRADKVWAMVQTRTNTPCVPVKPTSVLPGRMLPSPAHDTLDGYLALCLTHLFFIDRSLELWATPLSRVVAQQRNDAGTMFQLGVAAPLERDTYLEPLFQVEEAKVGLGAAKAVTNFCQSLDARIAAYAHITEDDLWPRDGRPGVDTHL